MSDGDAMGPNPLPDWTEDDIQLLTEKLSEEVKKEGNKIFSGMMTNCVPDSCTLSITLKDLIDMKEKIDKQFPEPKGVHITSIIPPDHGWPIVSHCDICKKTVILLSPYAVKPSDGDYFRLNGTCLDEEKHIKHNMYPQKWYPWKGDI